MADFNIMTAPISDEVDKGHVFGEVDNELVRFPATGLGGGSGEGGSSEVPPGVVFVETDETADPLPEEDEAEEGGLDADRLGGLTPPYFVKKSDLSDAFDAEKAYAVGDYCIYENALYRFTTAKEADAAWDSSYVIPVKIADEIGRVSGFISDISGRFTHDMYYIKNTSLTTALSNMLSEGSYGIFFFADVTDNPFSFSNGFLFAAFNSKYSASIRIIGISAATTTTTIEVKKLDYSPTI